MQESTPQLITPEQFNTKVRGWTISVRQRMAGNIPESTGALKRSLESFVLDNKEGIPIRAYFKFERHGVFIHYGVGRGYIRANGMVVPGRRLNKQEQGQYRKRGENRKDIAKMRILYNDGSVRRTPLDWFDMEIKVGIRELADIAQEYHGDAALERLLRQIDKATIQKK